MNWTKDKSLRLSKLCVCLFAGLLLCAVVALPLVLPHLGKIQLTMGVLLEEVMGNVLGMLAGAAVCGGVALAYLYGLLRAIGRNDVFCAQNVARLRVLSWCCLCAGLCFLTGCWFAPSLLLLSAAAAFVGLILRVVKNVFAQAVALKDEQDFTI